MGFETLLGNEQLKKNLSQSLGKGHISHFYLICGPEGSGKHTLARLSAGGEPIASNIMTVTPAAVEEYFNISSTVFIDVPAGCCTQISIQNDSTISVNIQNANLIVERVA